MRLYGSETELVSVQYRKNSQLITLRPNQATTYTAARDVQLPPQNADGVLVSADSMQTLTNKTINGASNTLTVRAASDITGQLPTANGGTAQNSTATFPTSGTVTTNTATATLQNKTLDNTNTATLLDTLFTLQDDGDNTKQLRLQLSGISTATTRTLTVPDASDTIVVLAATQSLSNKTLGNTNTITLKDTLFTLQDDGDATKQIQFQLSGITTGTTRVLTPPNATDILVGTSTAATLSNKTMDNTNTYTAQDNKFTLQDNSDNSKQLVFELSGITTATTRTLTAPDASTTILGTDATQVVTNKDIDGGTAANTRRITLPKDTNTNITALTRKQGTLLYDTTNNQVMYDNGTSLTALASAIVTDEPTSLINLGLATSVAANALTIALKNKAGNNPSAGDKVTIAFRNATSATGNYTTVDVTAALSLVVSSGSTLSQPSGAEGLIYVYAINNAGTAELAVSSALYDDGTVVTTVAEGGAGAADAFEVLYSTTARTNVPCRLIGRLRSTQATAGTWATTPSETTPGNVFSTNRYGTAYNLGTSQTGLTSGTQTVVAFDTQDWDTGRSFNTGTSTWSPTVKGRYQVNISVAATSSGATMTSFFFRFKKNGSNFLISPRWDLLANTAGNVVGQTLAAIIEITSTTDTYKVEARATTAGGLGTWTIEGGTEKSTSFSAVLLGTDAT